MCECSSSLHRLQKCLTFSSWHMFTAESSFVSIFLGFGRRVTHIKFLGEGLAGLAGLSQSELFSIRLLERLFLFQGEDSPDKISGTEDQTIFASNGVLSCDASWRLDLQNTGAHLLGQTSWCGSWLKCYSAQHREARGENWEGRSLWNFGRRNEADIESSVLQRDRGSWEGLF